MCVLLTALVAGVGGSKDMFDKLDQDQPPRDVTVLLDDIIGA